MMFLSPDNAGLSLVIIGLLLMAVEAHLPSFGAIGATGLLMFICGSFVLYDPGTSTILGFDPGIFAGIAVFGALTMAVTAYLAARTYRRKIETGAEGLIGSAAEIVEWSGKKGRVRVQGEIWKAQSDAAMDLKEGDKVAITKLENLTLIIRAD